MTRDEAMQLAEQAGIEKWWNEPNADQRSYEDAILRLVTLAAKASRESCAKLCEHGWKSGLGEKHQGDVFAAAIRARGDT